MIKFCPFILKMWSKIQILESIKGRNSVANLQKTTIYNANIDLVNDDVYTKFGLILSIRFKTLSNQRTNGPVNAHLIPWPTKAQNIQNLENI